MKLSLVLHLLMVNAIVLPAAGLADTLRVAVASNFAPALSTLAERFEQQTRHQVIVIPGSTGKHYAQIKQGAPFDLFFAADQQRPELLDQEGIAVPASRFSYAIGKLALWSPDLNLVDTTGAVLATGRFRYLAIANPRLAPYGKAAQETLTHLQLWEGLQKRLVRGENITQTYQFVNSGNAQLGFVAWSQIKQPGATVKGSYWLPPRDWYSPIVQQAVQLNAKPAASEFMAFIKSPTALQLIRDYGYDTP